MNKLNRPWTKDETQNYSNMNDEALIELNKTLCPTGGDKPYKLGIFVPGQVGDLAQVMGIIKYTELLWPQYKIIFFTNMPNADLLRYAPIDEVRPWPWAGNGLNSGEPDHFPFLCNTLNNTLSLELSKTRKDTNDIDLGFFPATHQVPSEKREGVEYSNVSKMVFRIPNDWGWHPCLSWSEEEKLAIKQFIDTLPKNRKTFLLETFAGSGQSPFYTVETTKKIMQTCRDKFGECNFIFGSHKHIGGENNIGLLNADLFDRDDRSCVNAGQFTPRQVALINDYVDLIIGISSGISVVTSAYGLKPTPKLQWCGSRICSTQAIAVGPFYLVEAEFKTKEVATKEFFNKLNEVLETI